jgi:uncharacterized membrane protein
MTLETTRILGGIGTILILIFPFAGSAGLVGIIGLILVMIALNQLAYHYKEPGIFSNALYGIITAIIGIATFTIAIATAATSFLNTIGIGQIAWNDWSAWSRIDWQRITNEISSDPTAFFNRFWPEITMVILAFVILFALLIIAALFARRSFRSVGAKTGIGAFYTAGMLMLVGAILTIIAIGFLLMWIAGIFLAIGFFRIKTT